MDSINGQSCVMKAITERTAELEWFVEMENPL